MAYELKTNTAIRIPVGPLVDPTDGKTAETGLTVTGLSVEIFKMANDGGAVVRTAFNPTASGGNNDMVHVADDTTGMYDLELTAAQLNFLGNARVNFYDIDGFLVHWIDLQVVSAAFWDWKYGTTIPKVDLDTIKTRAITCDSAVTVLASVGTAATSTAQTGDSYAIVNSGTHGNAALKTLIDTVDNFIDTEVAAILADTNELQTDLVNGGRLDLLIDSIITHLTDLKGTGFNGATDSNEAIRNRGDAAWVTATGFSTLDAAGVRTAVGLASANLDTQLGDIPTVTEMNNRTKPSADYFDPATDTVARVTLVDTCTTNTDMVAAAPSAASIADAVLDEAMAGHVAAGSLGKAVADVLEDTATTLPAAIDAVPTASEVKTALEAAGSHLTLIKAKTDKMTYTNGDDLDVNVQKINDVAVTGTGAVADPWGPA